MIFQPLDYQLDYLKALHLIYSAFPAPVKTTYYQVRIPANFDFSIDNSLYTHELDKYSNLKYNEFKDLPVFMIESSHKIQSAREYGNIFEQQDIAIVFPAYFGLQPNNADKIVFSSTQVSRLYKIKNIEISTLFENPPLRFYKLYLTPDKYNVDTILERIVDRYILNYDIWKFFKQDKYNLYQTYKSLLNLVLQKLDLMQLSTFCKEFLAYLYTKYKAIFNIMLAQYNYNNLPLLLPYNEILNMLTQETASTLSPQIFTQIYTDIDLDKFRQILDVFQGNYDISNIVNEIVKNQDNPDATCMDYIRYILILLIQIDNLLQNPV